MANVHEIRVCGGTGCHNNKSADLIKALKKAIRAAGLTETVKVVETGCFGLCEKGPIVMVCPEETFYSQVAEEDAEELINSHFVKGELFQKRLYKTIKDDIKRRAFSDTEFYKKQTHIALKNGGLIDPENIDEYLAVGGYTALEKVLKEMTPAEVVDVVTKSGLRGRGGGGFSTGQKWKFAMLAQGDKKYVACNADEGDPGAFMDRSILEGDPHAVVEAMAIAAFAIGADEGYVYVRAEYPTAVKHLQKAIDDAMEYGLLGEDILGTGFNFTLSIRLGAGAFVCGEETALLNSIEGLRGEPRPRPPYPANKGVFGCPTILNNVETYANITTIINEGWEKFAALGTEKSKGTKVFAIGGKINNTGLLEIAMGTTLREIIFDICGGIPNGRKFKAAQTGGPSGGCITEKNLDVPIDYDNLVAIGSMMGSGGLIVMDEDNCMVDVARFFMDFIVDESCGKCPTCRIGTKRMLEILEKICEGKGELADIDRLQDIAQTLANGALCALGQSASNPVLSTLAHFKDEYLAHIVDKKCPAGVCKNLTDYVILEDKCKACGLCRKNCPVDAIIGENKVVHVIDQEKCIKCGTCLANCAFDAIIKK
ncbi:MAG: NADH-quinone oxidoreductase subunit NuoF [Anaerofustis stercorihominis]|nr:NADH-quinone oxidoreductase subunit NuoF [Anaerofustis stercorihominis]